MKSSLTTIKVNLAIETFVENVTLAKIPYDSDDPLEIIQQNKRVVKKFLEEIVSETKIDTKYRMPVVPSDESLTQLKKVLRFNSTMVNEQLSSQRNLAN